MNWEPVIGLEIHAQLSTRSKIFSGAATAFGAEPNSQACPVDLGLPGVLPVLNAEVVRMAVKFGLAVGASISHKSVFDRKNYFYPDLPKGYQISQFHDPIVGQGRFDVKLENGEVLNVGITRAHLEEDAGKSVHDAFPGMTGIDLNRTGTPLLEIVSDPDFRTAAQASAYFRQMHALVRALRICDGDLSQGSMRCDANVSVRPVGQEEFGVRTEIKNINSFRFVEQAINYEIQRQIDVLESGGEVVRETRLYDSERVETRSMRGKEMSEDYRYFPDPDLLPVIIDDAFVESVRAELPEMADARSSRYQNELKLSAYDADWLTADPDVADYFEATVAASGDAKLSANWIMGELSAALNRDEATIAAAPVSAAELGQLIQRISDNTISSKIARTVFDELWQNAPPDNPDKSGDRIDVVIEAKGLKQMSNTGELESIIDGIVADNPAQVEQFRAGKEKVLGFFVGQIMKATQGKANPRQVNELLRSKLKG